MKKNIMRLVLISMLLLGCLAMAACGGSQQASEGPAVASISVSDSGKPQTVFPEGKDLDLSKGSLTVVYDSGRKETIALNAEGVTVSGYDKNKIGDQSLIVSYGGKSITLTVSVAKRMTFSGYEKEYFVGDSMDLDKGKVTIVKDDGSIASVRLNDPSISVVSFDSATAGKGKQATIRYSANGLEYTDTIAVNVYDVGNVKFVKPTKTVYGSHDTEMNLQGGYFTITAKDNEELTKPVPLTLDMISGFNPSATTRENIENALIQTISVAYAGQSYTFDIRLFYSGVSIMQDAIDSLKDMDLNAEEINISFEQGAIAREGVEAYMGLSAPDRALLVDGDVNRVARIFAMFAREHANALGAALADAVIFYNYDVLLTTDSTYDAVQNAITVLSDPNCELIQFHAFLREFVSAFGNVYVIDQITVKEYVPAFEEALFTSLVTGLQLMLDVHDDMSAIPEEWEAIDLIANYGALDSAITRLTTYQLPAMIPNITQIVSKWRANDDLLEIIYSFYYLYFRGMMMDEIGYKLPFPGPLQELYALISQAATISMNMEAAGAEALWADTTTFCYLHKLCVEKIDEIQNHENWLYEALYNFLEFDNLFKSYVIYPTVGMINMMGAGYCDDNVMALMDDYLDLVQKTMGSTELNLDFEGNRENFKSIMNQFTDLTPRMQLHFLSAIHYMYGTEAVLDSTLMTFPEEHEKGVFMFLVKSYYEEYMSEATITLVQDMLLAMEYYMNRDLYADGLDNFYAVMDKVNGSYATLSEKDKALFDEFMGDARAKYNVLYRLEKNGSTVDQELYANLFSQLVGVYREFETLLNSMVDPETSTLNGAAMGTAIAAYSYAKDLNEQILNMDNEDIIGLYSVLQLDWDGEHTFELDYLYAINTSFFLRAMHDITFSQIKEDGTQKLVYAWDVYSDADIDELMGAAYHIMIRAYKGSADFDTETVLNAMRVFRKTLDENYRAIYIFNSLGGDETYYPGLESFFDQVLQNSNKTLATKLIEAEKAYFAHVNARKDEEKKAEFLAIMEELFTMRQSVTAFENFETYLGEMYDFYAEKYEAVQAETDIEEE